jgi:hypothetical protein
MILSINLSIIKPLQDKNLELSSSDLSIFHSNQKEMEKIHMMLIFLHPSMGVAPPTSMGSKTGIASENFWKLLDSRPIKQK